MARTCTCHPINNSHFLFSAAGEKEADVLLDKHRPALCVRLFRRSVDVCLATCQWRKGNVAVT